jgi:hypothetical protein
METPSYIKSLLMPNGKKPAGRRVWSIDLETVWLPFFTSTNVMGETAIAAEALGAPLRLAYNADGSVKFSRTGRPVTKVAKELSDNIKLVRENFTATLQSYANGVIAENSEAYKLEVNKAIKAGEPIVSRDRQKLQEAVAKMREQELAEAIAEAEAKPRGKAKAKEAELAGVTS